MHLFWQAIWEDMNTHSQEKSYSCNQCNFASALAGNLRRCLKTHSGEKSFKFNQWDYEFVLAGSFRRHLKTHFWAQLAQHLFTHSGEKTHHCGSSLSHAGDLKKHLLIHTGGKPFKCAKCMFLSADSSGLNIGDSVIWSDPLRKAELKLWTVILVCYLLNRMAPRCKLIASHQLERPAPSCLHLNKGSSFSAPFFNCLIPDWIGFTIGYVSTALSTNFGQPETGPACRFPFCFLDISKRTIQLKVRVRTKASQDIFVGFNPLTIISGQGYISELIAQHSHFSDDWSSPSSQKMNGECSFFECHTMHWRSSF